MKDRNYPLDTISIQIPKETPNFRFYTQQNQQDDTQMTNST